MSSCKTSGTVRYASGLKAILKRQLVNSEIWTINDLSDNVMFVGDFNSKLESFGCAKKNTSGPMLQNIQNQLNLIYLNSDEHTHMDRANSSTDMPDMAFISPKLAKHDIQFQIGDDLGSDHLPIEISIDPPT